MIMQNQTLSKQEGGIGYHALKVEGAKTLEKLQNELRVSFIWVCFELKG